MKKRFFDKDDLLEFFSDWDIIDLSEDEMTRYTKPKTLWRGMVRSKKSIGNVEMDIHGKQLPIIVGTEVKDAHIAQGKE